MELRRVIVEQLGETEIEHLDPTLDRHHHVAGLQIAMGDAALVGRGDRVRELHPEAQDLARLETLAGDELVEGLALDVLHSEEALVLRLLDREQGDDVGVVERGHDLGLALEPPQPLGLPRHGRRQELERDVALQPGVLGEVDDAHAALAQLLQDAKVPQGPI